MDGNKDELPSYFMAVEATKRSTTDNRNSNENSNENVDDSNQPTPSIPLALSVHRLPISQLRPLPTLKPKDNQVEPSVTVAGNNRTTASSSTTSVGNPSRPLRPCRNCPDTMAYLKRIICDPRMTLTRRERTHRERLCFLCVFFIIAVVIVAMVINAAGKIDLIN